MAAEKRKLKEKKEKLHRVLKDAGVDPLTFGKTALTNGAVNAGKQMTGAILA